MIYGSWLFQQYQDYKTKFKIRIFSTYIAWHHNSLKSTIFNKPCKRIQCIFTRRLSKSLYLSSQNLFNLFPFAYISSPFPIPFGFNYLLPLHIASCLLPTFCFPKGQAAMPIKTRKYLHIQHFYVIASKANFPPQVKYCKFTHVTN